MNLTFHCAYRRKDKSSRISPKAAQYKKCRTKRGGKACKYSYVVEGGYVDEVHTETVSNITGVREVQKGV